MLHELIATMQIAVSRLAGQYSIQAQLHKIQLKYFKHIIRQPDKISLRSYILNSIIDIHPQHIFQQNSSDNRYFNLTDSPVQQPTI